MRIRRQDADALATYIANLQSTIASAFDDVQAAEDALANLASFRSDARDACVAYFNEVDKTMRDAITSALQDISDTYSNLFLGQFPDDAAYGDFDEDELYRIAMDFRSYGKKAHDIRKGINNIIGRAEGVVNSDFHGIGSDIAPDISDGFCECADAADGIRQSIDQLDKAQAANVSRIQQHVDDVADLIHGYMNDSTMQCDTYTAGSLQNNTAYAAVMVDNASTEDYHEQNAAAIANEQAALQDRIAVRSAPANSLAVSLLGVTATIAGFAGKGIDAAEVLRASYTMNFRPELGASLANVSLELTLPSWKNFMVSNGGNINAPEESGMQPATDAMNITSVSANAALLIGELVGVQAIVGIPIAVLSGTVGVASALVGIGIAGIEEAQIDFQTTEDIEKSTDGRDADDVYDPSQASGGGIY